MTSGIDFGQFTAADAIPRLRMAARRLGPAGLAGIALLSLVAVVAVSVILPAREHASEMREQLSALSEARSAMRDRSTTPTGGAGDFLSRFPTRDELPSVLAAFEASAGKAQVQLLQGSYAWETPKGASLSRYTIEFPVKGSYPALRDFMNRALVAVPAASLDSLRLERKEIAEGVVEAELRFTVFVRSAP